MVMRDTTTAPIRSVQQAVSGVWRSAAFAPTRESEIFWASRLAKVYQFPGGYVLGYEDGNRSFDIQAMSSTPPRVGIGTAMVQWLRGRYKAVYASDVLDESAGFWGKMREMGLVDGVRKEAVSANWFRSAVGRGAGMAVFAKGEFSWVCVEMPTDVAAKMASFCKAVDTDDLAEDGIEAESHITVKHGLHTDDAREVEMALRGCKGGKVRFTGVGLFENDDADVVKVEVDSLALHILHERLSRLPNSDKHPDYVPHATIAYVRPGLGGKYSRWSWGFDGVEFDFDEVVFENTRDEKTVIRLG